MSHCSLHLPEIIILKLKLLSIYSIVSPVSVCQLGIKENDDDDDDDLPRGVLSAAAGS